MFAYKQSWRLWCGLMPVLSKHISIHEGRWLDVMPDGTPHLPLVKLNIGTRSLALSPGQGEKSLEFCILGLSWKIWSVTWGNSFLWLYQLARWCPLLFSCRPPISSFLWSDWTDDLSSVGGHFIYPKPNSLLLAIHCGIFDSKWNVPHFCLSSLLDFLDPFWIERERERENSFMPVSSPSFL